MTLACSVYGLGLHVNVPIAGLKGLAVPEQIDVRMAVGSMPPQLDRLSTESCREFYVGDDVDDNGTPTIRVSKLGDGAYYLIAYADGTQIVIDARGNEIWATGPETATIEDTATYLLGPALGFTLRLRGITCLHASAVAIGDVAVAFVGSSGAGKSSTAAAFARLGYPVLTDDVAPLVDLGNRFKIQPAYPRVRLWPDAVASLFGAPDALPRITASWEKCYLDLNEHRYRFQREPLPLAAVYIFGNRDDAGGMPRLETMSAKSALMSLVSDTYTTRLLETSLRAQEFEVLGRLVENVPLRRLSPGACLAQIPALCETVVRDVRALTRRGG